MGLLNDVKATAPAKAETAEVKATDKSERKAKAKERKAEKREALKRIVDYLTKNPVEALKKDVELLAKQAERTGGFAPAFTHVDLFGEGAKAGAKISAVDVFVKFKKGYPEMKKYMKKWAEKGVKVELDATTQSYVLK